MAVAGKFETTRRCYCAGCKKWQTLVARATDWTGDLRTDLVCTTPGCNKALERGGGNKRATKGNVSHRENVPLFTFPGRDQVILEDYECSKAEAEHFCQMFRDVLQRIPIPACEALMSHWQTGRGSPHVWLLENRAEWGGNGWAASRTHGLSLCVVSTLIGHIPDEYVKTAIAHELGHTLFIAGGEEHHSPPVTTLNALLDPPRGDPLRRYRQEWLVWRQIESWGFDQPEMEIWMERNLIDDSTGIRLRVHPISEAEFEGKCFSDRREIEQLLRDMRFPATFENYLNG